VFTSAVKVGEPLHPDRVTKVFDEHQAAIRAGIAERRKESGVKGEPPAFPRIRLHDVRHTFATLGAQKGVPPKVMAEILGHDVMTYMQTYVHNLPGMQENAAELIAGGIFAG